MKQMYFFITTFLCCSINLIASESITSIGNIGQAFSDMPSDYQNDLWLNTNYQELNVGDTYQLVSRRVPEGVVNLVSNDLQHPNYNYEVVYGSSISIVAGTNGLSEITANSLGTSVIAITYDAFTHSNGNKVFAASSPINTAYMVIDVVDENNNPNISIESKFDIRSYDTQYMLGESVAYTFEVTANGADAIKVFCNGSEATKDGDNYTITLLNRENIVEIVASNALGTKKLFHIVDARKIEINIDNLTRPGANNIYANDEVSVSFTGIVLPVYKLATIYNPCMNAWGGVAATVNYNNATLGEVKTDSPTQYNLATHNAIKFTVSEAGEYQFTNGHIYEMWWGSALGSEKDMNGPGEPNLNAPTNDSEFSTLPNFSISVKGGNANFENFILTPESVVRTIDDLDGSRNYYTGLFDFEVRMDYGGYYWDGIAISNQTDNSSAGGVNNQYNSAAGGDINGTGNYGVVYDGVGGGMPDLDAAIYINVDKTLFPDGKEISGLYVSNNTYASTSMRYGDGFAKAFGGDTGDDPDWFKITAFGYDKEGDETNTSEFYLADYRFDNNALDYVLEDWKWFDLSDLGTVSKVRFLLTSSDGGEYGMNTPSYFCIDNIDKKELELNKRITNIEANLGDADISISLLDLFSIVDPDNIGTVLKQVASNTADDCVAADIQGDDLKIAFLKAGNSNITINGKLDGIVVSETFQVNVGIPTNNANMDIANSISIYPNPSNGVFRINTGHNETSLVQIYNIAGQSIYANPQYQNNSIIDLSKFEKGHYLIRIKRASKTSTHKFIIK